MDEAGAMKYCELMREVKNRVYSINLVLDGKCTLGFIPVNAEFVYLQFRKILELIAFGSLVANFKTYSRVRSDYSRDWKATRFLKNIEQINKEFYPDPVEHRQLEGQLPYRNFEAFEGDYLTMEEFKVLYDVCGGFMHSENPYGDTHKYAELLEEAPAWLKKIVNLLNLHIVNFVDGTGCLIQMGDNDMQVSFAIFGPAIHTS